MNIAIRCYGLKRHVKTAVAVAEIIGDSPANAVEQNGKAVRVPQIGINVAIEFPRHFEPHLQRRNVSDGGIDSSHVAQAGEAAIRHEAIRGEGEGFDCLRLKVQR